MCHYESWKQLSRTSKYDAKNIRRKKEIFFRVEFKKIYKFEFDKCTLYLLATCKFEAIFQPISFKVPMNSSINFID